MKKTILLLLITLLSLTAAHGQALTLAMTDGPQVTNYSATSYTNNNEHKKKCTTSIVGLVAIGAGTLSLVGGLEEIGNAGLTSNTNSNQLNTGVILVVGAPVF